MTNHTKQWLKKQPLWHDSDMALVLLIGILTGSLIGYLIKWML